jgi:hypothetical protein
MPRNVVGTQGTGTCVCTDGGSPARQDYVLSASYARNDQWIISGSKDRSVQFWCDHSWCTGGCVRV